MKVTFSQKQNSKSDALVIAVSDSLKLGEQASAINKDAGDALKKAIKARGYKGNKNELLSIVAPAGVKYSQIIIAFSPKLSSFKVFLLPITPSSSLMQPSIKTVAATSPPDKI